MKFLLSILLILFPFFAFAEGIFTDVTNWHKNIKAIEYLQERWIISGYSDWTFKPLNLVNRVEALKILIISGWIDLNADDQISLWFTDTSESSWYAKYLSIWKNLWIVKWYPDWTFHPSNAVNLAETLKMLLETNNVNYDKSISQSPYFDVPVSAWFVGYFDYAKNNWLLDDNNAWNISPWKEMSRWEFSEIIYRFLLKKESQEQYKNNADMYPSSYNWKNTTSWEVYSEEELTASHREYSFWSRLKVTNQKNWKSIIVKVNDREINNPDREIRLSKKAFYSISSWGEKLLSVKLEQINLNLNEDLEVSDSCIFPSEKWKIKKNFFKNITLSKDINAFFRENEIYNISWTVDWGYDNVNIFIINDDWKRANFEWDVINWFFSIDIDLQEWGEKQIWIIPWKNGVSLLANIDVKSINCEKNFSETYNIKPKNLTSKIKNWDVYLKWKWTWSLVKLVFTQWGNKLVKYINKPDDYIKINPVWFKDFSRWEAYYQLFLTSTDWDYSFDQNKAWSVSDSKLVNIIDHNYYFIDPEIVEMDSIPSTYVFWWKIKFSWRNKDDIKTRADIILPNNTVSSIDISSTNNKIKNKNWVETFQKLSKFNFSFSPSEHWTYIFEINHVSWIAWLNIPIYEEWFLPVIPDYKDLYDQQEPIKDLDISKLRSQLISMINKDRNLVWSQKLILNPSLNQLAQDKANDIVQRNYFSHWNPEWKSMNDLRFNYAIKTQVSENLAKDISLEYAHFWLMRSAGHRKNILDKDWTRCWLWFSISWDWVLNVVEIFSPSPITESSMDSLRNEVVDKINLKRSDYLITNSVLHALAQNWSNDMSIKGFDDFVSPDDITLSSQIREAWITSMFSSFIVSHYSFQWALEEILKSWEAEMQKSPFDTVWKKIWVWIAQDTNWNVKMTLIYTN